MIKINLLRTILIFLSFTLLFSEKSSDEIQKDIEKKNKEAQSLKTEIDKLATQIQNKDIQSKTGTQKLSRIKEKIDLTEQLIKLLKKDERFLSSSIVETELNIKVKEKELEEIKEKFSKMILHLYKTKSDNYLDILLKSKNWEDIVYKVKYLEVLSHEHQKIKVRIESIVNQLDNEILLLTNQLLDKKFNQERKNLSINELDIEKVKEKQKINKIKLEKFDLEKDRSEKKTLLVQINQMIEKLYVDKDDAKNREEKLKSIREEKRRKKIQDSQKVKKFSTLKGKMPWPVDGSIINDFGFESERDGLKERKLWIEMKTKKDGDVRSVFDGIVAIIDFNPVYKSYIIIDHGDGYSTLYANLNDQSIQVSDQDYIEAQTVIGKTLNSSDGRNDFYGLLYFMIFGLTNDKKLQNYNPRDWIK